MSGMLRMTEAEFRAQLKRRAKIQPGRIVRPMGMPEIGEPKPVTPKLPKGRPKSAVLARSELEVALRSQIEEAGLKTPEYDQPYLIGTRHRLDVLWRDIRFGVEVQGMVHRIKGKFKADISKRATGLLQGWTVLEVDGDSIRNGKAIEWIKILLRQKGE